MNLIKNNVISKKNNIDMFLLREYIIRDNITVVIINDTLLEGKSLITTEKLLGFKETEV